MEYNYVIFGSDWDLYKQSYSDIYGLENVKYISGHTDGKYGLIKKLCKLHFSAFLYNYFDVPGKSIWNATYFKDDFKTKRPLCFIFMGGWLEFDNYGLFNYLKKNYPEAKYVLFLQDLINKIRRGNKWLQVDVERVKTTFDLILSFDQSNCDTYGFIYHPLVFSSYHGIIDNKIADSDVYFLGKAKNRLSEIIGAFEKLRSFGLKCDFYLVGVKEEDQVYKDEICYISGMDYQTNLQHILHTKCLLEVMQQNGTGYTQRMCEAVALDKKIITNNSRIDEAPFYNNKYILKYRNPSEIAKEFCVNLKFNETVDYHYKEKFSPKELLTFIKERL